MSFYYTKNSRENYLHEFLSLDYEYGHTFADCNNTVLAGNFHRKNYNIKS